MGCPTWEHTVRQAIAEAKGGGGFKGGNVEPVDLPEFLETVAREWPHTEPEEFSPGERPLDDPRNPNHPEYGVDEATRWSNEQEAIELQRGGQG